MCGFVGIVSRKNNLTIEMITNMTRSLHHRGPDSNGTWINSNDTVAMGHTRLSILDLSDAGSQPMYSFSKRYVICFNGEIYNHHDIREELISRNRHMSFIGNTDTETLLTGFEYWGVKETISKSVGMFGFSVYDFHTNTLTIGRDRFGEKPVYYGWQDDCFFFGSELKAIRACNLFRPEVSKEALGLYMQFGYVPGPYAIYKNVFKLNPGTLLHIYISDNCRENAEKYWSLSDDVHIGFNDPFSGSDAEAIDLLGAKLTAAIKGQQLSDVPVGAFLSGGIDSSLIVSIMQAQSSVPINTFTIGFKEKQYNEAGHAKKVAKYLHTNHTELYLGSSEVLTVIPQLPTLYDEPFADSSQLPTFLVSQLARQNVTVCLSGDAGDEIFGGYNRYNQAVKFVGKYSVGRHLLSKVLLGITPLQINSLYELVKVFLPKSLNSSNPGMHLHKLAGILELDNEWDIYHRLVSIIAKPSHIVKGYKQIEINHHFNDIPSRMSFAEKMMYTDAITYLCDDILCKVDRAAMGVSLETRVPFLDHRVTSFAWSLPLKMKIREGNGKWILRQLLYRHVPKELVDRPKIGFGLPLDLWLRGPLRDWVESLINKKEIEQQGFLDAIEVRKIWDDHCSGRKNLQYELWNILMFCAWQKQWL